MLTGCHHTLVSTRSIPPELEKYVIEFEQIYNKRVNYSIVFGKLKENNIGKCNIRGRFRKITIDLEFYEKYKDNEYVIHQLIFHELGHCTLLLDHNNGLDEIFREISIMNSYAFGNKFYYQHNLDYYIDSLIDHRIVPLDLNLYNKMWNCKKPH